MTAISSNHIARAIYGATQDRSPSERVLILKNAVKFLAKKRLLPRSKNILEALERIINAEDNRIHVKIFSAEKLSEKHKHDLAEPLKKRYGAEKISWSENIDETLLNGFRIEKDDEVIDLSARKKIKQLQEYLIKE